MNIERIKQLREYLSSNFDETRFDMGRWCRLTEQHENICKTASCLAGWAIAVFEPNATTSLSVGYLLKVGEHRFELPTYAADLLELSEDEADWLFRGFFVGDEMHLEDITLAHAIKALDHLIAGGSIFDEDEFDGFTIIREL